MTAFRIAALSLVALSAIALIVLPVGARHWSKDEPADRTITVIEEDGKTYVCHVVDGKRLTVHDKDSGEEIVDLDLRELHATVEEALEEVHVALAELEDIHIDIDWDDDGILELDIDDVHMAVDIDEIMSEMVEVVSLVGEITLDELDLDDLDDIHIHWDDEDHDDRDELEQELDELRDEIERLKKELKEARRRRH